MPDSELCASYAKYSLILATILEIVIVPILQKKKTEAQGSEEFSHEYLIIFRH